jgi:hypothetical protein
MRSSPCARGKERRSGVSSDLWFPKIPSSRIRAVSRNQKSSKNSGTRDGARIAGEIKKRNRKLLTAGVAQKQAKLVDSGQRIVSEFAAL